MLVPTTVLAALRTAEIGLQDARTVAERETANILAALCHALEHDDSGMLGAVHSGVVRARELRGAPLQPYPWTSERKLALVLYDRVAKIGVEVGEDRRGAVRTFAEQTFALLDEAGLRYRIRTDWDVFVQRHFNIIHDGDLDPDYHRDVSRERARGRCVLRVFAMRGRRSRLMVASEKDRRNLVHLLLALGGIAPDGEALASAIRARKARRRARDGRQRPTEA